MDGSSPGFPILHYLPVFAQTHVYWVGDAIQPSHSLPPPSPFAFNLSQHQSESEVAQSCPTLCDPMDCSLPGSSLHGILQARVLEWVAISSSRGSSQPRDQTRVSHIPGIKVFSNKLVVFIRWPKYCSFSFSISPSNEYLKLEDLNWFDLLAVQGALKSLLQHHSSKASILWPSAFFMVQLSNLHMTTGKIIALTIWTFISKVISLPYNMMLVLS